MWAYDLLSKQQFTRHMTKRLSVVIHDERGYVRFQQGGDACVRERPLCWGVYGIPCF